MKRVVKKYVTTGLKEASIRGGVTATKYNDEIIIRLLSLINDNFLYTLSELRAALYIDVHLSTLWRWLKKLNYTYKIVRPIPERRNDPEVKLERKVYVSCI